MRESESQWLRRQISNLEERLALVESGGATSSPATESSHLLVPPSPPTYPAGGTQPPPPSRGDRPTPTSWPPPPDFGASPHRSEIPPERAFVLPAAETMLKWSGLALLLLSAVFLVSTAIQRGWIGPELQLLGAAAIGAALIGGGLRLGREREGWDKPLVGAGVAVLSACAGAGWVWLELGDRFVWVLAALVVLTLASVLTKHLDSPGLGATSLVTVMIALAALAGDRNELGLLLLVAMLTMEAMSAWLRRPSLHLLTSTATLIAFGLVAIDASLSTDPGSLTPLLGSGTLATLAMWFAPLAFVWRPMLDSRVAPAWRAMTERLPLSLPVLLGSAIALSRDLDEQTSGRLFLVIAGVALLLGVGTVSQVRNRPPIGLTHVLGGMAALVVGSALLMDGPALLASLVAQSAALLVLIQWFDDRFAKWQAAATTTLAGGFTLVRIFEAIDSDLSVVNDVLHLVVVALIGAWALLERSRQRGLVLAGVAYGGFLLWAVSALVHLPQGQAWISVAWAIAGLGALAVGIGHERTGVTRVGLASLAVVIVKLLTVDLAAVDTFWRVLLFFVLGGTFLAASYRTGTIIRSMDESDHVHPDRVTAPPNDLK